MMGFFQQLGGAVPTTTLDLIAYSTPVTQGVLVILVVLSLMSWAIMVLKWLEFRRAEQASRTVWREFEDLRSLDEARQMARRSEPNPFTRILSRAISYLGELRGNRRGGMAASPHYADPGVESEPLTGSQVEALRLVLDAETISERDRMGRFVAILAVIGSVSPLLGLLGTVIGVISAFLGIAREGSGNIAAVAPGVAEALVATAAALSVAIPAMFGYNIFASRLNRLDGELEAFGSEIIALLVREREI